MEAVKNKVPGAQSAPGMGESNLLVRPDSPTGGIYNSAGQSENILQRAKRLKREQAREDERKPPRSGRYNCPYARVHQFQHGDIIVPCDRCGFCADNRINDWIGRCVAEALSCFDVWALTLTYRDSEDGHIPRGAIDPISEDIADFMRSLRDRARYECRTKGLPWFGADLRYLAVYDRGAEGDRGHWHVIIFHRTAANRGSLQKGDLRRHFLRAPDCWLPPVNWKPKRGDAFRQSLDDDKVLNLQPGRKYRQLWKYWPHGLVSVESMRIEVTQRNQDPFSMIRYVTRYLHKKTAEKELWHPNKKPETYEDVRKLLWSQRSKIPFPHRQFSKKPSLGHDYFMVWASEHVDKSLPLNDFCYTFPGVYKKPSVKKKHRLVKRIEAGRGFGLEDLRGRRRVFELTGVMREQMTAHYLRLRGIKFPEKCPTTGGQAVVTMLSMWQRREFGSLDEREKLARLAGLGFDDQGNLVVIEKPDAPSNPFAPTPNPEFVSRVEQTEHEATQDEWHRADGLVKVRLGSESATLVFMTEIAKDSTRQNKAIVESYKLQVKSEDTLRAASERFLIPETASLRALERGPPIRAGTRNIMREIGFELPAK